MSTEPNDSQMPSRRATDRGALCTLALRASQFWDWIDKRDIDKHLISLGVLYGTVEVTAWAMRYAEHAARPGLEVAAIVAAVGAPYMALQAAAIAFYFRSRTG